MPRVTVDLPSMLSRITGAPAAVSVEASTLRSALDAVVEQHPALASHLFDEQGVFREHVLCFHNQTNTRWLPSPDVAMSDGDTVTILQAVSGG